MAATFNQNVLQTNLTIVNQPLFPNTINSNDVDFNLGPQKQRSQNSPQNDGLLHIDRTVLAQEEGDDHQAHRGGPKRKTQASH